MENSQTFSTEASTFGSGSGSGLSVSIGSLAGFSSEVEGAGSATKRIKYLNHKKQSLLTLVLTA